MQLSSQGSQGMLQFCSFCKMKTRFVCGLLDVVWSRVVWLDETLDCHWSCPFTTDHEFAETETTWCCLVTARSRTQSFFTKNCKIFYIHCRCWMWWRMGRNSEIFIITIRLEQTRSVTLWKKKYFLIIIHQNYCIIHVSCSSTAGEPF